MSPKILVIEDEIDIINLISHNLEKEGYRVQGITNGAEALDLVHKDNPDLIILDVMIPDIDGFELCRQFKATDETSHIPIIFLTAKTEEHHIVSGLELGADDYVTKPFSMPVLIARVRKALRRETTQESDQKTLRFNGLELWPDQFKVKVDGKSVHLTSSEFRILESLAKKPGWVFSRDQLIDMARGEDHIITDRTIDVMVFSLRKKLGKRSNYIETVRSVGYRFSLEP